MSDNVAEWSRKQLLEAAQQVGITPDDWVENSETGRKYQVKDARFEPALRRIVERLFGGMIVKFFPFPVAATIPPLIASKSKGKSGNDANVPSRHNNLILIVLLVSPIAKCCVSKSQGYCF